MSYHMLYITTELLDSIHPGNGYTHTYTNYHHWKTCALIHKLEYIKATLGEKKKEGETKKTLVMQLLLKQKHKHDNYKKGIF